MGQEGDKTDLQFHMLKRHRSTDSAMSLCKVPVHEKGQGTYISGHVTHSSGCESTCNTAGVAGPSDGNSTFD